jgi:hypothetical protein
MIRQSRHIDKLSASRYTNADRQLETVTITFQQKKFNLNFV